MTDYRPVPFSPKNTMTQYKVLPWILDEAELTLDRFFAQLRVGSNHSGYVEKHFKTFVPLIINEGKMKNDKPRKKASNTTITWVNTQLSDTDVADFLDNERTDVEILTGLLALVSTGYELAFKHDTAASCWRAYLFNKVDFEDVDFGLSCFADTPRDTLDLLLFKFYRVLGGEWPDPESQPAKRKFG